MLETEDQIKQIKVKSFNDYTNLLRKNEIILDHNERSEYILKKLSRYVKRNFAKKL